MNSVQYVKDLCKERKIAISKLERDCGFSNGYIRGLKNGRLPYDRAVKVAEYLGISVEYLLTGTISEGNDGWYLNEETARVAQEVYEDPDLRLLFDAAKDSKPENIRLAAEMLQRFKEMSGS